MAETAGPSGQNHNGRYVMSRTRLLISIAAASLLAVGATACCGDDQDGHRERSRRRDARRNDVGQDGDHHRERPADRPRLARRDLEERQGSGRAVRRRGLRAAAGGRRGLAGAADRAGDREEARRPRRAAPGRCRADAGGPEGRDAPASRSSTSTGCSPRPTPRRRRCSATTTRSACWRPTTSPSS